MLAVRSNSSLGCNLYPLRTLLFLQRSVDPTYQKMWAFMSADPTVFVRSYEEGIRRVRESNGRYVFIMQSTVNDYTNQRMPCDTVRIGGIFNRKGFGIGIPFHSDLR